MIVKFVPGVGARLRVKTKDGKEYNNDQIESVEVVPFFALPTSLSEVVQAVIVSENRGEVGRHGISVTGKDGKVTARAIIESAVSAVPLIDKPRPALAGAAAKQAERAKSAQAVA